MKNMKDIKSLLSYEHIKDLKQSGLSDETILKAEIRGVPPSEIRRKLGFDIDGLISCYEIPYSNNFSRFRCFYKNGDQGKPKYLQKKGSGNHLYIPNILDPKILKDPSIPLYITEGEKKALKAVQEGIPCIAIAGLWNWSNGFGELIHDFEQIEFKNRQVFIVPDNDWLRPNKHGYKKNLEEAVRRLAIKLIERGADVHVKELPQSEEKVGLDDYLCKNTVEEFLRLSSKPVIPDQALFKKAMDILKNEDPLKFIVSELSMKYLLRDKELTFTYLCCLLPKLRENNIVLVTGESSVGKSELLSTVFQAIPTSDKLVIHSSSQKALLYRGRSLNQINLWIREFEGAKEIEQLMKILLTERQAVHLTVDDSKRGKVYRELELKAEGLTLFITSTRGKFNEELENRGFQVTITGSEELYEAVTKSYALTASGDGHEEMPNFELLKEIYKLIKPLPVIVPFAPELQKFLRKDRPRVMRDFKKIISLIKASALLNQHQREIKNGAVVAERKDYENVFNISGLILESISELKGHHKKFLKFCEDWITREDLVKKTGKSPETVRKYISELSQYLLIDGKGKDQKIKCSYMPMEYPPLPEPDTLFSIPKSQLTNSLEKSISYTGNNENSQFFPESQFGKLGKIGKNDFSQCNHLKNKEKNVIGILGTENYIWDNFDLSKLEVLE